jgi:hypothetical protein
MRRAAASPAYPAPTIAQSKLIVPRTRRTGTGRGASRATHPQLSSLRGKRATRRSSEGKPTASLRFDAPQA